jgi:tetratricopeptide (TPR) repeat protein
MSGGTRTRIILVISGIALAVVIFLLPKTPKPKNDIAGTLENVPAFSFQEYLESAHKMLSFNDRERVDSLLDLNRTTDLTVYDSIAYIYDLNGQRGVAAFYFEEKALNDNTEESHLNAAYRYFDAFKAADDSLQRSYFVEEAINAYRQVLELNPANLNAKTDLGICLTEGTNQPMQGITLLREVVAENPDHEYAQMNLGFLSMKSGQFDKAVERFRKVLEINPSRLDMYVYLGESYVQLGQNEDAIQNFRIFANLSGDPELVEQVNKYIEELESKGVNP